MFFLGSDDLFSSSLADSLSESLSSYAVSSGQDPNTKKHTTFKSIDDERHADALLDITTEIPQYEQDFRSRIGRQVDKLRRLKNEKFCSTSSTYTFAHLDPNHLSGSRSV